MPTDNRLHTILKTELIIHTSCCLKWIVSPSLIMIAYNLFVSVQLSVQLLGQFIKSNSITCSRSTHIQHKYRKDLCHSGLVIK